MTHAWSKQVGFRYESQISGVPDLFVIRFKRPAERAMVPKTPGNVSTFSMPLVLPLLLFSKSSTARSTNAFRIRNLNHYFCRTLLRWPHFEAILTLRIASQRRWQMIFIVFDQFSLSVEKVFAIRSRQKGPGIPGAGTSSRREPHPPPQSR